MIIFGSLPGLGWLAPPKSTRAWEPTLSWNQCRQRFVQAVTSPSMRRPVAVKAFLLFLNPPFIPSWRRGVQSGPEQSRARWLRRQRTLDGEDRSAILPPERKEAVALYFFQWVLLPNQACKPSLSPPFHPHSCVSDFCARCKLGVLVSVGAATCFSTCLPSPG
jgi:hypothetical protein